MSLADARARVAAGDAEAVRRIDGHFAIVAGQGQAVRLARSIGRPFRYFIAKRQAGPCLVAADRIDVIQKYLQLEGLADQFHPSYTRMVPAHYITEIALIGCPDPNPVYRRFFAPRRNTLGTELTAIGTAYIGSLQQEIEKWLRRRATQGPVGVCF